MTVTFEQDETTTPSSPTDTIGNWAQPNPLQRWLRETPEQGPIPLARIWAFPARKPVPGEHRPWESASGRTTTQPRRGPRRAPARSWNRASPGSPASSAATAAYSPRSNRSSRSHVRLTQAHQQQPEQQQQQQQQGAAGGGGERVSAEPHRRRPIPLTPNSGVFVRSGTPNNDPASYIDPRLLQRNRHGNQTGNPFLIPPMALPPPPLTMEHYPLLGNPGQTLSHFGAGHQPSAARPASALAPAGTGRADWENSIWEFLRFDSEEEEGVGDGQGR